MGLWCCITIQDLAIKCSVVQEISSGQHSPTFLTFTVALTLNAVDPFFHRTLWLMRLYYQTKSGCKWSSTLEDIVEIVIFWLYKPALWLSHWTLWTSFSARHTGLWCCITIPGLVTKCSVGQKISSGQAFTNIINLHCDLDLECSNPMFPQDTLAYDAVPSNQVWLQTDQQFRRYCKNCHILII